MMDGITVLPKCIRCHGAFYPDPDPNNWMHKACPDCWQVVADEWLAEYDSYQTGRPTEYICLDYYATRIAA